MCYPNQLEYWGPNGIIWYRNVQFRFTAWSKGDSNLMIAAERPGASADGGIYADRIELQGVKPRNPMPDITGHFRLSGKGGHIQVAGLYRRIQWDDLNATPTRDLSGHANGWGVNASSNIKLSKHVLHLQAVYGHGVENYMNDAPADVGIQNNFSNPKTPILGKALPALGTNRFPGPQLEQEVYQHHRILPGGYQHHGRSGGNLLQVWPIRPHEPPLLPG